MGLGLDNSGGVSSIHIRFNLKSLEACRKSNVDCLPRAVLTLPWLNFLVTKRYKWEHEALLALAVPACPAGLPHHSQLELI